LILERMITSGRRSWTTVRFSVSPFVASRSRAFNADFRVCLVISAREEVVKLIGKIEGHLNDNRRGEIMRSGVKVSIFGPPNAGKVSSSRLFHSLSSRVSSLSQTHLSKHTYSCHPLFRRCAVLPPQSPLPTRRCHRLSHPWNNPRHRHRLSRYRWSESRPERYSWTERNGG